MYKMKVVLDALPVTEEQVMGLAFSGRAVLAAALVLAAVIAAAVIIRKRRK